MAESSVRRAVENRGSGLVKNGGGGLLDVSRLLILRIGVCIAVLHTGDIKPFRSAGLVARKVIARQQHGGEDGMVDVNASVNDGHDAGAGDAKTVLRVLEADDLGRRLCRIAVPNDGAVVIYGGSVVKTGGNAAERRRRLLEEVTRKFWPTGPSRLPWTWHWRRLQRFKTEDKPPVVRTMYRFCAAAGFGATTVRMISAKMMAVRFIVATTWVSPAIRLFVSWRLWLPSSVIGQTFRANSTSVSSCLNKLASGVGTFVPEHRRGPVR